MGAVNFSSFELMWESRTCYLNRFYEYQSELDSEAERMAANPNILSVAKRVDGVTTVVKKSKDSTAIYTKV